MDEAANIYYNSPYTVNILYPTEPLSPLHIFKHSLTISYLTNKKIPNNCGL